jgi:hypothetical protein
MIATPLLRSVGRLATLGCIALIGWPSSARAIGPLNQIISDAPPVPTLYDTASFLIQSTTGGTYANGGGTYGVGTFLQLGSGALIGVSAPEDGNVCLAILTADHVARFINGNTVDVGFGPGQLSAAGAVVPLAQAYPFMTLANTYATYTVPGSPGPTEDLSIVKATVNLASLTPAQLAYYNKVTAQTFLLAGFTGVPSGGTAAANVPFTEYGYGTAGTFQPGPPAQYVSVTPGPGDARRFQNNTVTTVLAPGPDNYGGGYWQPEVAFNAAAPNASGNGLGLQGDSGGPLLVEGDSGSVTVLSATPASGGAPAGPIPVNFTDDEFAEYVANIPPPTPVPSLEFAVPLVPGAGGSLPWALNYADNPMSVPEPGALSLAATAGFVFLLTRRVMRRRSALITASRVAAPKSCG